MQVFVTGGGGFVGTHVQRVLRDRGHSVIAPRQLDLDLRDVPAITKVLRDERVDAIVHLAASLDKFDEAGQWRDTFDTGRCVLAAAVEAGVKRLTMAGSLDELGSVEGLVDEHTALHPGSLYGLAKAMLLQVAQFQADRHGLSVEWVRPTIIYGPGQGGPMLIPAAFRAARFGGEAMFSSGVQRRDFVYVGDVAEWFGRSVEIRRAESGVRLHHLGSGSPIAVKDVLRRIEAFGSTPFVLGAGAMRPGETMELGVYPFACDVEPLRNWRPMTTLDEGLQATWQWWQEQ